MRGFENKPASKYIKKPYRKKDNDKGKKDRVNKHLTGI
jgi:hypothetical protein